MFKNGLTILLAGGAIGVVAVNGCSSSSSGGGPAADAAADAAPGPIHRSDAAPPGTLIDSGDDGAGPEASNVVADGTTGKACTMNSDCTTTGANICSSNASAAAQFWPSPVCIEAIPSAAGNCDPGVDMRVHFCDGPDASSSPGVCVALTNPPTTGNGLCLPKCTFAFDGRAPKGCVGKNTCNPVEFTLTANVVTAYGFCQGTCQSDADCASFGAQWACQQDTGFCTTQKTTVSPVGTPCLADGGTATCNCVGGTMGVAGYCTSACVVGGTACPTGYVCDAGIPSVLNFGTTGTRPGPTVQNPGLAGFCLLACTTSDGGAPVVAPEAGTTGEAGPLSEAGTSTESGAPADASPAPSGGCPAGLTCRVGSVAGSTCQ